MKQFKRWDNKLYQILDEVNTRLANFDECIGLERAYLAELAGFITSALQITSDLVHRGKI